MLTMQILSVRQRLTAAGKLICFVWELDYFTWDRRFSVRLWRQVLWLDVVTFRRNLLLHSQRALWIKEWVCGRSLAGIVGSNPAEGRMFFSCECCVLSYRGLCVGLIARTEDSYGVWFVHRVWTGSSVRGRHDPRSGRSVTEKKNERRGIRWRTKRSVPPQRH